MFSSFSGVYLGLECIPAVLYAKSVFSFLRTGQTIFSGSCPVSYVLTSNAPKGPHFHIPSGLSLFLFSSSRGCEVHFIVALICISLMLNDVEHLFTCSLSHSGVFSGEMSTPLIGPCLKWILFLSYWVTRILYICTPVPSHVYDLPVYSRVLLPLSWWCPSKHKRFWFWCCPPYQLLFIICVYLRTPCLVQGPEELMSVLLFQK